MKQNTFHTLNLCLRTNVKYTMRKNMRKNGGFYEKNIEKVLFGNYDSGYGHVHVPTRLFYSRKECGIKEENRDAENRGKKQDKNKKQEKKAYL